MSDYVVRVNRQDGSIEVSGPDKEWVDSKLDQFSYIYKEDVRMDVTAAPVTPRIEDVSSRKALPTKRPEINPQLKELLTRPHMERLLRFIDERKKAFDASLPAQAIIIAIFLEDELQWKGIDKNDLLTVYRELGLPHGNTEAQLKNAYNRKHYFSNVENGKYIPSSAGDSFARYGSRNAE